MRKIYIANFSGGKDSTAMIITLIEHNYPLDYIVFADTGVEFPEVLHNITKVNEYLNKFNKHIIIVRNDKDFFYYITEHKRTRGSQIGKPYSFPTIRSRWCTSNLKITPVNRFKKELKRIYKDVIFVDYVGYAYDEQHRVKRMIETQTQKYIFPLIEHKITEEQALEISYQHGFTWNGLYNNLKRVSCWICPLKPIKQYKYLIEQRPELWSKIKEIEQQLKEKGVKEWKFTPSYSTDEIEELTL